MIYSEIAGYVMIFYHFTYTTRSYNVTIRRFALLVSILILGEVLENRLGEVHAVVSEKC